MQTPKKSQHSWASKPSKGKTKKNGSFLKNIFLQKKKSDSHSAKKLSRISFKGLFKNLVLLGIALFLLGTIAFLGLFAWIARDLPDPGSLSDREVAQSTKIYDRTGEHLLYEIFGDENRTLLKIQEGFCEENPAMELDPMNGIPLISLQATIAAEDRNFCYHHGFSIAGLARAVLYGGSRGGGSTLTQQLVKNAILTNERTLIRKAKELILSAALERRYSKDEILQIYFNEIPYGSTYYGIETAAQNYYGKSAYELSLGEAATLAALPQLPTYYLNNPDELKARRDWIIGSMAELGFVTEEEATAAKSTDTPLERRVDGMQAPHFVLWVKEQLVEEYGELTVEQGGLKVYTTLDFEKQKIAEQAITDNKETLGEIYDFNNSGLVAMDPTNGEILAMVGSADYFDDEIDGQVNVTLRPLQPGSSFKPIVYTAAFEEGYTPNTLIWDVETDFPSSSGTYHPRNYNLQEIGAVTIRKALQGSLNIPAVKALYLIGVDTGLDFAERLGYTTFEDRSNFGLAVVLGGAEVKLLEHVAAYSVFANDGLYHEPISIKRVENSTGEILFESEERGEEVIDANIAHMITNVLSDNNARSYAFGPYSLLQLGARPVAAKTGTTNNYKDAWTIGYTPSLVAGVWTGNTDGHTMNNAGGSTVAAPVWNAFMKQALEGTDIEYFPAVSIPNTGKSILDGEIPSETVVIDTVSQKLATEYTPERFREEKTCGEFHSILYFVDKYNPTGPIPENPASDPAYTTWEEAVQRYLEEENSSLEEGEAPKEVCEIPTEYDDVHVPENIPSLRITSPSMREEVGRTLRVDIEASAPRGIDRIEYRIDGTIVLISSSRGGARFTLPSWVDKGFHTVTVTVYDDADNAKSQEVRVEVTEDGSSSFIRILNPFTNQQINKLETTYPISIEIPQPEELEYLSIFAENNWTGMRQQIAQTSDISYSNTFPWELPDAATYRIYAQGLTSTRTSIDAKPVQVDIIEPVEVTEEETIEE